MMHAIGAQPAAPNVTPRWGFRVASSPTVGAGHMVRSLAVAQAIGAPVHFFVDPDSQWDTALAAGDFASTKENATHSVAALFEAVVAGQVNAVLFDGYGFRERVIETVSRKAFTAAFSDDGVGRPATLLINPCPDGRRDDRTLTGLEYAPLAAAYADMHSRAYRRSDAEAPHVLIAFGSRDSSNCTGLALDALTAVDAPLPVTVVLGARAPHQAEVRRQIAALPQAQLLIDCDDMASLYMSATLAIGAPGVSFFERMCCGLPSILVLQNATQRPVARWARDRDVAAVAETDSAAVATVLRRVMDDATWRRAVRRRGLEWVDGRGADRLAAALNARAAGAARSASSSTG